MVLHDKRVRELDSEPKGPALGGLFQPTQLVPVTVCSDLLKPGGYGRASGYLKELARRMSKVNAGCIDDFVLRAHGNALAALDELEAEPGQKEAARRALGEEGSIKARVPAGLFAAGTPPIETPTTATSSTQSRISRASRGRSNTGVSRVLDNPLLKPPRLLRLPAPPGTFSASGVTALPVYVSSVVHG